MTKRDTVRQSSSYGWFNGGDDKKNERKISEKFLFYKPVGSTTSVLSWYTVNLNCILCVLVYI